MFARSYRYLVQQTRIQRKRDTHRTSRNKLGNWNTCCCCFIAFVAPAQATPHVAQAEPGRRRRLTHCCKYLELELFPSCLIISTFRRPNHRRQRSNTRSGSQESLAAVHTAHATPRRHATRTPPAGDESFSRQSSRMLTSGSCCTNSAARRAAGLD